MVYVTMLVATLLVAVIGNLVACTIIFKVRALHRHTTYKLLFSMAISDLLASVFVIPIKVAIALDNMNFCFGILVCQIRLTADVTFFVASVTHLLFVCLDRYLSIVRPYHYQYSFVKNHWRWCICFIWFNAILWGVILNNVNLTPDISGALSGSQVFAVREYSCEKNDLNFVRCLYSVTFFVPCVVMVLLYHQIWRVAVRQSREIDKFKGRPPRPLSCFEEEDNEEEEEEEQGSGCLIDVTNQQHAGKEKRISVAMKIGDKGNVELEHEMLNMKAEGFDKNEVCQQTDLRQQQQQQQHGFENKQTNLFTNDGRTASTTTTAIKTKYSNINKDMKNANKKKEKKKQVSSHFIIEFKATRVILVVFGTFMLCYIPTCFMTFVHTFKPFEISKTFFTVWEYLPNLNSCLNPFIYCFFHKEFKTGLRMLLKQKSFEKTHRRSFMKRLRKNEVLEKKI